MVLWENFTITVKMEEEKNKVESISIKQAELNLLLIHLKWEMQVMKDKATN